MQDREEAQALAGLIAMFAITAAWWALALWPVQSGPEWLARTRYVCFGIGDSGLPDTGGWIGLIAGPLGMASILAVGWFNAFVRLARRARRSRPLAGVFTTLAIGVMVLAVGAGVRVRQARVPALTIDDGAPADNYPRLNVPAPALRMIVQNGDTLDLASLRGRPVIVTFAYAHCTTVCPLIVNQAIQAQSRLRETDDYPALLVVTLDPWRDTPGLLPTIARSWGLPEDAWVMSDAPHSVEATLDAWNVSRSRDEHTGEVTHPSLLYVIDRDGTIAYATTGGADAITSLIRRL